MPIPLAHPGIAASLSARQWGTAVSRNHSGRARSQTTVEVPAISIVGGSRARLANMSGGAALGTVCRGAARAAGGRPVAPPRVPPAARARPRGVRAYYRGPGPWLGVRTHRDPGLFG